MNTSCSNGDRNGPWPYAYLESLSDENLIEELAGGCHDALAVLFDRYHRLMLGIAANVLRDSGEAEDLVQTVFMEIYRVAGVFDRSKGKAKAWLVRYAYHRSLDRRRHLAVRGFYDSVENEKSERLAGKNLLVGAHKHWNSFELSRILEEGFDAITDDQRKTLYLFFFEGLSMRDIAGRLGATLANVRHHYYRGLYKLRLFINGQRASSQDEDRSERKSPYVES